MPSTQVVFYTDNPENEPQVLLWLETLPAKARAKCVVRIERLADMGHELRRPEAAPLRDGIYELRTRHLNVQYRILYFFHGRDVAILSHGIVKEGSAVDNGEIDKAVAKKTRFVAAPDRHTYGD